MKYLEVSQKLSTTKTGGFKQMKLKRIAAFFLSLAMVLTFIPSALADPFNVTISHARAITVPAQPTLSGTLTGETGSGAHFVGATVNIYAGERTGWDFAGWTTTSAGVSFDNAGSAATSFVMPGNVVTVTATWTVKPSFSVTIENSPTGTPAVTNQSRTPTGNVMEGTSVTINAGSRANHRFDGWTITAGPGNTPPSPADASSSTTTFVMPGFPVIVTANWTPVFAVTVNMNSGNGTPTGAGNYAAGEVVTLNAGTRSGFTFNNWTSTSNGVVFAAASSATTTFSMPANAVTVTANWTQNAQHLVTLNLGGSSGGGGGGNHSQGATVTIRAGTRGGHSFSNWAVISGGVVLANSTSPVTTFDMPAGTVEITANWVTPAETFAFAVVGGATGSGLTAAGNFAPGTAINIRAAVPTAGTVFSDWSVTGGATLHFTSGNLNNSTATFIMPAAPVTITANTATGYSLTVSGSQLVAGKAANQSGQGVYNSGDAVTIRAGTAPAGQTFTGWTVSPTVAFTGGTNANSMNATFNMPANNVTATATWSGGDQAIVNGVRDWVTWERIRGSNAAQTNVTNTASSRYQVASNLSLTTSPPTTVGTPAVSTAGTTMAWTVVTGSGINTSGVVTATAAVTATIRVTVTKGTGSAAVSATKDFFLNISPPSGDQAAVNAAMTWLVWNEFRGFNPARTSAPFEAYHNLVLPTSRTVDGRTVNISWSSNTTARITNAGVVTPPSSGTSDVVMTATFTGGSVTGTSNTKTFTITVRNATNAEAVNVTRELLTWDAIKGTNASPTAITANLNLYTAGECGAVITWASSNPAVVAANGSVTRPAAGSENVILSATISRSQSGSPNASDTTRSFAVTVGDPTFNISRTANRYDATISAAGFNTLTNNGARGFSLLLNRSGSVSFDAVINFDAAAARAIGLNASGNITVVLERQESTDGRPVYDLRVSAGERIVTDFSGGSATLSISYVLLPGETANALSVFDLNRNTLVARSQYNTESSSVVFATGRASRFAIRHNDPVATVFTDAAAIDNTWNGEARQHITFVTSRGLYNGNLHANGSRSFGPGDTMTRAQFVAVLRNFDGADLAGYSRPTFADVLDNQWHTAIIAWGQSIGLFGSANSAHLFRPDEAITREDMALWLYNYAVKSNIQLPAVRNLQFSDIESRSGEHRTAIQVLANAGIISGFPDGTYGPLRTGTRADVAAIIAQFVRTVVK
jgi:uncharacterized repeat protein (TIGR02543 family)